MSKKTEERQHDSNNVGLQILRNKALYTGFIGGIMASASAVFLYFFNFINIHPKSFVLTSWNDASWTDGKLGTTISIILFGLLSIVVAFIYFLILKNINSIWIGIIYGVVLWGIVFYALHPLFPNVPPLKELDASTIVSSLCLYVLYSVFIGYTISYDYAIFKHKKHTE